MDPSDRAAASGGDAVGPPEKPADPLRAKDAEPAEPVKHGAEAEHRTEAEHYVSRAGVKLAFALGAFHIDPAGMTVADFGSNVGGFVDCLLQRNAARVYAIDTGYGVLAWKLRKDARVVTRERANALRIVLPERVDLVTVDVGWTRQHQALPAAKRALRPGGQIITLIKPHYENPAALKSGGVLSAIQAAETLALTLEQIRGLGFTVRGSVPSPLVGQHGNAEYLAWVTPT